MYPNKREKHIKNIESWKHKKCLLKMRINSGLVPRTFGLFHVFASTSQYSIDLFQVYFNHDTVLDVNRPLLQGHIPAGLIGDVCGSSGIKVLVEPTPDDFDLR